jgi:hypothetical protein
MWRVQTLMLISTARQVKINRICVLVTALWALRFSGGGDNARSSSSAYRFAELVGELLGIMAFVCHSEDSKVPYATCTQRFMETKSTTSSEAPAALRYVPRSPARCRLGKLRGAAKHWRQIDGTTRDHSASSPGWTAGFARTSLV